MKAKKIIALTMSVAMAVGAASLIAACTDKDKDKDNTGNTTYVEDTTVYHCAGQSNGPDANLYNQGWNQTSAGATDKVTFVKDTTVTDKNVFTLEMKMYADDQFKIVHDEAWEGEITSYYFTNAEEDSTYNYVAKTDGEVIFRDYSSSSSNITLTEGHDGIYKFTLVTDPSASDPKAKYQLSYELVEAIDRLQIPFKMSVLGDINDFGWGGVSGEMESANGTWTYMLEVTDNDLIRNAEGEEVTTGGLYSALYVANLGDGTGEANEKFAFVDSSLNTATVQVEGEDVLVNLLPAGKWAISFNEETKSLTIKEVAYELYFIGGWYEGGWEVNEGYKNYPLTPNSDGTIWTGVIDLSDRDSVTELKIFNAKGTGNKYLPNSKPDNYKLEPGKYVFKYNTETDTVEFDKFSYYLVGSFIDEFNKAQNFVIVNGLTPKLQATETENVYEVTLQVSDVTGNSELGWVASDGGIFAFQIVYGTYILGIDNNDWGYNGGNQYITEAGTYKITIDLTTKGTPATWELVTEEVEKLTGYYIVGSFVDENNEAQNFKIVEGLTPMLTETAFNPYAVSTTLEIKDVTSHSSFGWISGGVFALQLVYGEYDAENNDNGGVINWNLNGPGNYMVEKEGTYTFTYNTVTGAFTVTEVVE